MKISCFSKVLSQLSFLKFILNNLNIKNKSFENKELKNLSNSIKNGHFFFSKFVDKTTESLIADLIVKEAMLFLLLTIPMFKQEDAYLKKPFPSTILSIIKYNSKDSHWCISLRLNLSVGSLKSKSLFNFLQLNIKDQAFLDLIYKYLKTVRVNYSRSVKIYELIHKEPLLISLISVWQQSVENQFISCLKLQGIEDLELQYIRYFDRVLLKIHGKRKKTKLIENYLQIFFSTFSNNGLKEKVCFKTYHYSFSSIMFLGYSFTSKRIGTKRYFQSNAPLTLVTKYLINKGYAKSNRNPTRNTRLVNLSLYQIVNHYKELELEILHYYRLAENFDELAVNLHYILKYSCALTIASKMKLKTKRKVFMKYGKNLNIRDSNGKIQVRYPELLYKKDLVKAVSSNNRLKLKFYRFILELEN